MRGVWINHWLPARVEVTRTHPGWHTTLLTTLAICLFELTIIKFKIIADELRHAFSISKPKVVFASNSTYKRVQEIQLEFPFVRTIFNVEADDYKAACQQMRKTDLVHEFQARSKSTDVATLLYSSGSTGLSKGVKLSHRNYIYLMEFYR